MRPIKKGIGWSGLDVHSSGVAEPWLLGLSSIPPTAIRPELIVFSVPTETPNRVVVPASPGIARAPTPVAIRAAAPMMTPTVLSALPIR
ncbi:hypothetical protein D3C72_288280 [compost metagenome]